MTWAADANALAGPSTVTPPCTIGTSSVPVSGNVAAGSCEILVTNGVVIASPNRLANGDFRNDHADRHGQRIGLAHTDVALGVEFAVQDGKDDALLRTRGVQVLLIIALLDRA